jgi:uncharacterized protein YkwD
VTLRRHLLFPLLLAALVAGSTAALRLQAQTQTTAPVTRAEAVTVLMRSMNIEVPERRNDGQYPDLMEGAWYVSAMLEAVELGMLDPQATFGLLYPHGPATRAQFLKLMSIAFALPTNIPHEFSDVPERAWFYPYAGTAYQHDLFPGTKTSKNLQPNALLSHAEVAEAIFRTQQAFPEVTRQETQGRREYPALAQTRTTRTTGGVIPRAVIESARTRIPATPATTQQVQVSLRNQYVQDEDLAIRTRRRVLELTNQERIKADLPPLRLNMMLQTAAQKHAKDLWQNEYFDHHSQDGRSYVDRIRAEGYFNDPGVCGCDLTCYCRPRFAVGENLAKGQLSAEQVVSEWMASEGHKQNILQPAFAEIGIGLFGTVWVQNFGKIEMVKEFVEVR